MFFSTWKTELPLILHELTDTAFENYLFYRDDFMLCLPSNERAIFGLNPFYINSWKLFLIYPCIAYDWVLADKAVPYKIEQSIGISECSTIKLSLLLVNIISGRNEADLMLKWILFNLEFVANHSPCDSNFLCQNKY